ncbi:putative disease resistance protein RGA3 [Panicum virgatum]|uniref:NB-ARC domain-containing protein n=1 Tax=Panicum virgatum TaxID=38727 RepID=A0A8T0ST38_PANVG|nr:putative disease resistance protein RGA3 [Panicum virgatum]KAG2600344.1 hypothetical protein PVAP13_5KG468400 [Panicum virgatum]
METLASAILCDLISRSVTFALDRCCHRWRKAGGMDDAPQRLRRVLLRVQAVVEEADRRRVTNQAMLRQLQLMREGVYRGYYLLSAIKRQGVHDEVGSLRDRSSFATSLFNPAKRLCTVSARTTPASTAPEDTGREEGVEVEAELQEVLAGLERMASDMKELVVFLSSYPPARREPYSGHLWLENRMFGREAEQEKIIHFLLGPEPAGAEDLGVLPVIGRPRVGKSTLVEHVCLDERVRGHFSLIVFLSQGDIEDGKLSPHLEENGTIKYRDLDPARKSLVVIELVGDVDENTWWGRTLSVLRGRRTTPVSRIIVTSRSEKIASFGTTQALELKSLPREAYWYFFKTIAVGSTGAEDQPELASVCMEMADLLNGCLIAANLLGGMLRANPCPQFRRRVLSVVRHYIKMQLLHFGEHPSDLLLMNGRPIYLWRLSKADTVLTAHHTYQASSSQEHDLPKITLNELQVGSARPRGKFEVVGWRSRIPPYYSYLMSCEVQTLPSFLRVPRMNKQIQRRRQPRLNSV